MTATEQPVKRPLVRYHGGKWMMGPKIIAHFPAHRIYTESFGGGGSILLRKQRSYSEIYNDLDGEIVNLFRVVRDRGDELVRAIELTPFSRDEFLGSYTPSDDPLEQARLTMARSFMGFGSASASGAKTGFRSNSNRSGTTPAHDWRNYPGCLAATIDRLRGVVIENKDACAVMADHDTPETLHYVDPPYVFETRSNANPYCKKGYKHEMTDEQHRELAKFLRTLKGCVILSGYACPLYDQELYPDWRRTEFPALADGARERVEVLWMRNVPATVHAQEVML